MIGCCWRILCVAWLHLHELEVLQTEVLQSLSASANQDGVCPCLFMLPQIAVWDPDQQQAAIEDQQGGTGSPQQRNSMDLHDQINSRYHCQPICHDLAYLIICDSLIYTSLLCAAVQIIFIHSME